MTRLFTTLDAIPERGFYVVLITISIVIIIIDRLIMTDE